VVRNRTVVGGQAKQKAVYRMNKKKRKMADKVSVTKKTIASRCLQLKAGYALTAVYLERINKKESQKCWWCHHMR
jgi:hypothetical protein